MGALALFETGADLGGEISASDRREQDAVAIVSIGEVEPSVRAIRAGVQRVACRPQARPGFRGSFASEMWQNERRTRRDIANDSRVYASVETDMLF